ncbi:MAG TPA: Rap1a/Tai family immunity protein [Terriglobales bacterium]|nr:Rap1a/Tai family immunity protein [Terriglobales bacterium]
MKTLLLIGVLLAGTALWAQTPYDLSDGRDLQALCEANTKDASLNALAHTFCMGYIRGVAEQAGFIKSPKACVPRGVSDADMKKMISRFLQQNPRYLREKATTVIQAAMQAAFHCK